MRGGGGGDRLEEGMKVEANYKGKGKFYKGKIARDNRDGTYDITYDDGDREFGKLIALGNERDRQGPEVLSRETSCDLLHRPDDLVVGAARPAASLACLERRRVLE